MLGPYVARLDVGVTVFFLISGFLLYRPFVESPGERPRQAPHRCLRMAALPADRARLLGRAHG